MFKKSKAVELEGMKFAYFPFYNVRQSSALPICSFIFYKHGIMCYALTLQNIPLYSETGEAWSLFLKKAENFAFPLKKKSNTACHFPFILNIELPFSFPS